MSETISLGGQIRGANVTPSNRRYIGDGQGSSPQNDKASQRLLVEITSSWLRFIQGRWQCTIQPIYGVVLVPFSSAKCAVFESERQSAVRNVRSRASTRLPVLLLVLSFPSAHSSGQSGRLHYTSKDHYKLFDTIKGPPLCGCFLGLGHSQKKGK